MKLGILLIGLCAAFHHGRRQRYIPDIEEYQPLPLEYQRIHYYQAARPEPDERPQVEKPDWGMPRSKWLELKKRYRARFRAWKEEMGPDGLKRLRQRTIRKQRALARKRRSDE